MLTRASVGAGLPHGLAVDVAAGGLWLLDRGADGARAVLDGLNAAAGRTGSEPSGFCAAVDGPGFFDRILIERIGTQWRLTAVDAPLLAIGLAGAASAAEGTSGAEGAVALRADDGPCRPEAPPRPGADLVAEHVSAAAPPRPRLTRLSIDPEVAQGLRDYGVKTLTPASDASRLSGAGAGLRDGD